MLSPEGAMVFKGRLTLDDVTHMQHYYDLLHLGRPVRWLAALFFSAVIAVSSWAMISTVGLHPVGIGAIAICSVFLLAPWQRRWWVRRHYRKHAEEYLETEVVLTKDRVSVENVMYRFDFQWKLVEVICDTPEGLLFCKPPQQVLFWLPARLFVDNQHRQRVLDLAISNNVRTRHLS